MHNEKLYRGSLITNLLGVLGDAWGNQRPTSQICPAALLRSPKPVSHAVLMHQNYLQGGVSVGQAERRGYI